MSEQGVEVHLACDGLNRTGQVAPVSHDRNRGIGNILPVGPGRIRRYTLGREKNRRGRQGWENDNDRRDMRIEDQFQGEEGCESRNTCTSREALILRILDLTEDELDVFISHAAEELNLLTDLVRQCSNRP